DGSGDDFSNGLAFATDTPSPTHAAPTHNVPTVPTQLPAAETSSAAASDAKSGTSTAAKAGIAIGILAAILFVFGLVYLFVATRKKSSKRRSLDDDDDEKLNGPFGQTDAELRAQPNAPRVSLRPVTQFLPNLNIANKGTPYGSAPPAAAGA